MTDTRDDFFPSLLVILASIFAVQAGIDIVAAVEATITTAVPTRRPRRGEMSEPRSLSDRCRI